MSEKTPVPEEYILTDQQQAKIETRKNTCSAIQDARLQVLLIQDQIAQTEKKMSSGQYQQYQEYHQDLLTQARTHLAQAQQEYEALGGDAAYAEFVNQHPELFQRE